MVNNYTSQIRSILLVFMFTNVISFSQPLNQSWGASVSVGLIQKVQLNYVASEKVQINFEVGNILYDDSFQIGNLGLSMKYFFPQKSLSFYSGLSFSYINIEESIYYFHIPLGLQTFATDELAIFGGFNPGVIFAGSTSFVLAAELGATFYF